MNSQSKPTKNGNDLDRLSEELRGWGQVSIDSATTNLSASSLVNKHRQRRRLVQLSSGVATVLLLALVWMVWPNARTNHSELISQQDNTKTIEQLRADLEKTLDEIAHLRKQTDDWQESSLHEINQTSIVATKSIGVDEPQNATTSLTIDDELLDAQWQAARRQTALSHALDQWLAVHP